MRVTISMIPPAFLLALAVVFTCTSVWADPARDAKRYVSAIERINAAHAKNPRDTSEKELAEGIPRTAVVSLARLLKAEASEEITAALVRCGEAALDLSQMDHFARIRNHLLKVDPAAAASLGDAVARDRFLVRGFGALDKGYLDAFAELTNAILDAYDEVFGFKEWSKVPGKKIRLRVHLEDRITRPPHFAPQFPYHSEIDMPVVNPKTFNSPTEKGQMLLYGLCHEFGHLVAMWGDRTREEDHHAWAHYTGVVIVDHMAASPKYRDVISNCRDGRWRSLKLERDKPENAVTPSTRNKPGVMSLLIKLHDTSGPKAIGDALNLMNEKNFGHRINHVRYYSFADLKKALRTVITDRDKRTAAAAIFP